MLFLTPEERDYWSELTDRARQGQLSANLPFPEMRPALRPAFRFHVGAVLAAAGQVSTALPWLKTGALEEQGSMACAYLASFLERHGSLTMPTVVFEDPRPYIHFTTVPTMVATRSAFREFAVRTLPQYDQPLRFMDIGCGNGAMGLELLQHLQEQLVIPSVGEIILVDPFPAMLETARVSACAAFPDALVTTISGRSQDVAANLPTGIDLTLCSLSIHHMPWDVKIPLVQRLASCSKDLLLFELNGDHDLHEIGAPELSLSLYQTYGVLIDAIFAHDTPVDAALSCVDLFLLAELVSLLTQPRGERTEYHMTQEQWKRLCEQEAGCRLAGMETCLAGSGSELFGQHYIKSEKPVC